MRLHAIALTLAGCGGRMTAFNEDSPLTTTVSIEAVDPTWGPPEGGTAVTVTGDGFEGAVSVWFGNAELGVTRLDANTLVVTSPAAGVEAAVDVRVVSDKGEDVLEGGFVFADEAPEETDADADADADSDADADGTGAVIEMSLLQIACPDCFGATQSIVVQAGAAFHEPVGGTWTGWLPAAGSCVVDPPSPQPTSTFLDVGEWLYLESGSRLVGLRRALNEDGQPEYAADGLLESDYARSAAYDVTLADNDELGAFTIEDAMETPQSITALEPFELLYVDPSAAFAPVVHKSGTSFSWSPYGGTGLFVIAIQVYNSAGTALLGEVLCVDNDNGSMTVPSAVLSSFPTGSLLGVTLMRYQITESVIPTNGAVAESVASFGVLGTATLAP